MPFLLLIGLMAACMPIAWPPSVFGGTQSDSIWMTGSVVLGMLFLFAWVSRRTVVRLQTDSLHRESIARQYGRARSFLFLLSLMSYAAMLLFLGWGWAVRDLMTIPIKGGHRADFPTVNDFLFSGYGTGESIREIEWLILPGMEFLILLPFLVILVGSWFFFYDAERQFHRLSDFEDAENPFWSRWGYVLFRSRQFLVLVFVPVFLLTFQQGLIRLYPELSKSDFVRILSLLVVPLLLIFLPAALPFLLGLKPLPPGIHRDRLEAHAKRLGFRYRDIYLWDTRNGVANAMVVGILPRFRYVVFTDRLLYELDDDEIDGVFGHEVGHANHGHLILYAVFLLLSVLFIGGLYEILHREWPGAKQDQNWIILAPVLFMGAYMFVVFGFLSRRCERQADLYGCRAGSCSNPYCKGHDEKTELVREGRGLCRTGIDAFIRALERVETINGMNRVSRNDSRGGIFRWVRGTLHTVVSWVQTWQHSTIAKRIAFLHRVSENLELERRFQRRIAIVKGVILTVLIGSLISMTLIWGKDVLLGAM